MAQISHRDGTRRAPSLWTGLGVALLGAVLVVIGALQTTSSNPNQACPDGTDLIAKFNFEGGQYVFEKPAGNANVVTITNGTATGGDATSTVAISAVIVKGGPDAVLVTYKPPVTSLHFSNVALPPVGQGNVPDISNVQFCGGSHSESTTTTNQSTTTTNESTTTTNESTTTTNDEATTTTNDESTTTTNDESTTTTTGTPVATTTTTTVSGVGPEVPGSSTSIAEVSPPPVTSIVVLSGTETLATTGSPSVPLIVLGAALIAAGVTMVVVGRARERRATIE